MTLRLSLKRGIIGILRLRRLLYDFFKKDTLAMTIEAHRFELFLDELLRGLTNELVYFFEFVLDLRFVHVTDEVLPHLLYTCHDLVQVELFFCFLDEEILGQTVVNDVVCEGLDRCWVEI
jgi:hypothetical protein